MLAVEQLQYGNSSCFQNMATKSWIFRMKSVCSSPLLVLLLVLVAVGTGNSVCRDVGLSLSQQAEGGLWWDQRGGAGTSVPAAPTVGSQEEAWVQSLRGIFPKLLPLLPG